MLPFLQADHLWVVWRKEGGDVFARSWVLIVVYVGHRGAAGVIGWACDADGDWVDIACLDNHRQWSLQGAIW